MPVPTQPQACRPRLGFLSALNRQVERVEAVGEPAVHRSEKARGPQTRGPVRPSLDESWDDPTAGYR